MSENTELNKNNQEKNNKRQDVKFKLGDIKGFEEAVKKLKLNEKNYPPFRHT